MSNQDNSLSIPGKLALSRAEAAQRLSISIPSLDRAVVRGLLKPSRIGRRLVFTVAELQRFLDESRQEVAQ
ncbi:MAG TPA: helix-turn-helix domain-containing protein [Opitutaceae bacterium]|nr:helix-turn-helix domain-containing protein [Opitutaceae bacterium]